MANDLEIPILLVYSPVTKAEYNKYTNSEQYDKLMSAKAPYINFNINSDLDDNLHFYDHHHMNQEGVVKFNNRLAGVLKELDLAMSGPSNCIEQTSGSP